ncbi:maturation protein [ssRNA phage Gerhypos.4_53]|uniref:Maturation protein n=2 Tax=Leviviricetes TaxID=2842243 RepID=A0A8S5L4C3_9VIRU|nr:maturation protein [ssRNA phage Gerhypos.4_53]QDH89354.1 MAG: hypothetical protein H4Bulk47249_000003 [Leviviridae sp.]DAD52042.1 TPA_asm: maturation protein [ssRNA phage Gerhypos.4_53]
MSGRGRTRTIKGQATSQIPYQIGRFSRSWSGYIDGVWTTNWYPQDPIFYTPPSAQPQKSQVTYDEIHKGPPYREGGPFLSCKLTIDYPLRGIFGSGSFGNNNWRYDGGFTPPHPSNFGYPFSSFTADSTFLNLDDELVQSYGPHADSYGAETWSRTKPKIETAGMFVALAELEDIPRMVETTGRGLRDAWSAIRTADSAVRGELSRGDIMRQVAREPLMQPRTLADQFLNEQFAWIPFLNDVRNFGKTFAHQDSIADNLSLNNGRVVRKHAPMITESSSSVLQEIDFVDTTDIFPVAFPREMLSGPTTRTLIEETSISVGGMGAFQYYLPEWDKADNRYYSAWGRIMRELDTYGARISPYHLYQIIPWSWALDWVTGMGNYVSYLSDVMTDSLCAKYFFVKAKKKTSRTLRYRIPFVFGSADVSFTRSIEITERQPGSSPFSFDLPWSSLTPRQIAIAGALGLTHSSYYHPR